MEPEQKERVKLSITYEYQELQQIEAGQYPVWARWPGRQLPDVPSLDERRRYADWCLKSVLNALIPTLPEDVRQMVQACSNLREKVWSEEYQEAYTREKTSPESLATAG